MRFRIYFTGLTVKFLRKRLERAYQLGDKRLVRRISALLAYSQGQEIESIAQDLSVSQESIYAWLRAFLVDRFESLVYHKTPGRPSRLTKTQKRHLKKIITAGPLSYGFTRGCWSSLMVQEVILSEFGVLYNRNYVCELLKNLGFSYQKAKFVSAHIDPKARKKWLEETWLEILLKAKDKNAMVLFVDEASFPQWGTLSYTWAIRGQQPKVQTSGKRKGYKVFGAADVLSGRLFYQGIEDRFNSETYTQFLTRVIQKTKQHLIIIQDGARYHTSKATQAFFQTHQARLTRYQLPSYSPDFNPIEHLWQAVRDDATHNKYFAQFDEVIDSVENTLRSLVRHRKQVRQILGDYATAEDIMPKAA
jgi:transposase|tara:strand:- start:31 stop:1116 length:1086 start_codon:yes stop_codon:yes gene_type:complete